MCALSVMSDSLLPHRLQSSRLHCPCGFSGKNTGVGCHFSSRGSSHTRDPTHISCTEGGFFTTEPPGMEYNHNQIIQKRKTRNYPQTGKKRERENKEQMLTGFVFFLFKYSSVLSSLKLSFQESRTIKKAAHGRIDALGLWCWRRLESLLDCKIESVNPKGNQP